MGSARKFSWLTVRVNFKRRAAAILALALLCSGVPLPAAGADPIDQQGPITTVIASPSAPDGHSGWYKAAPEIAFSTDESATTFYAWDSIETAAFESVPATLSAPGGVHIRLTTIRLI